MGKEVIAKSLGMFFYMVSEAILGKTRFGSWLGFFKSVVWFAVGIVLARITGKLKQPLIGARSIGMVGVDKIKAVLGAAIDGANLGLEIKKDGKIDMTSDLPMALALVQDLPSAISDLSEVPAQLEDMDSAEAADLVAFAMAKLNLEEGKAKLVLGQSLKVLGEVAVLVQVIKA